MIDYRPERAPPSDIIGIRENLPQPPDPADTEKPPEKNAVNEYLLIIPKKALFLSNQAAKIKFGL